MTAHAIPIWAIPTVPVVGGAAFPVRRIYCVGRNYAAHAREMGGDPDREPPFFFQKPADAIVMTGSTIRYPKATKDFHHEIELVVAIGTGGEDISEDDAESHIFGYAVGLDMTRRDLQGEAKRGGRPWDMGKGFDQSAPIAPIHRSDSVSGITNAAIWLKVDGQITQSASVADLIWSVPETIAHLSRLVRLEPGDLIFTGTPEGVGPVLPGQTMHGHVDGLSDLSITVAAE